MEIHVRDRCDCENGMVATDVWQTFNERYLAEPRRTREEFANAFWRERGCDWTIADTLPEEERPCQRCGGSGVLEQWVPLPAELADLFRGAAVL